jgi:hypothetical protein
MTVNVLYRNHQWMVQDEPKGWFIVEVNKHNPDDTESGYWIKVSDLEYDLHFPILHLAEKNWVDVDAFELAVLYALILFDIKPRYSVAGKFAEARKIKAFCGEDWQSIGDVAVRVIGRIKPGDAA